ncbi:MAG: zf-HC2 domain-containing protein [Gammaproteobacteria bacterium]|nr:zf-HC2 domain-containing protein [Gammaproteobacteria bacterium]
MAGRSRDHHETVVELLPWFVNGTLGEPETALVETHVHECVQCFSLLQQERQLHDLLSEESSSMISSAAHGFERLRPRLEPEAVLFGKRSTSWWGRAEGLALAAGLAALAVTVLVWQRSDEAPMLGAGEFETLSQPATAASLTVDIIFSPELPETEMRSLLQANGAIIVNGPTELGRYTIRIDRTAETLELDAIIEQLRNDPRVRFVGPSFISEVPQG